MSTGKENGRIAVIGGDGIGPEVCAEALKVVAAAGGFRQHYASAGGTRAASGRLAW